MCYFFNKQIGAYHRKNYESPVNQANKSDQNISNIAVLVQLKFEHTDISYFPNTKS